MIQLIQVPHLGEQKQTEIVLNMWYVEPGQQVNAGDDLVELVTDKAAFNVPAPADGRVTQVFAAEGAKLVSGDRLLEIETGD